MAKLFKWLAYTLAVIILLIVGIFAAAYWNRDRLLAKINEEVNKQIDGTFNIEKMDFTLLHNFPNFSITLNKVTLQDRQFDKPEQQIFSANKVFVELSLYPLVKKQVVANSIAIEDADIFVFKTTNGDSNTDLFKRERKIDDPQGPERNPSLVFDIDEIDFENVSVLLVDSSKNKVLDFKLLATTNTLLHQDSGYMIALAGDVYVDSLHFNPKAGSYLKNKNIYVDLNINLNPGRDLLTVLPSTLRYERETISMSGQFETKPKGPYSLSFKSIDVDPSVAQELLTEKLKRSLSKFKCDGNVTVDVTVKGRSEPNVIPDVDVSFETKDADFHYAGLDFYSLTAKGSFTNHVNASKSNDNANSKLVISHFAGAMEKLPVKGKVTFTQLQDPVIELWFTSGLTHKDVNSHLDNNRFVVEKGKFTSEVAYTGKLSEYLDPTRTSYSGKLKGSIKADDASLIYKPKKIRLDNIQLTGEFNETMFTVKRLNVHANGSPITMSGTMQDFIPFFIQPKNKAKVALKVNSPRLDLTTFATPRDLKKRSQRQKDNTRKRMTELLDKVYDRLEFEVDLYVDELTFRKFKGTKFKGKVRLHDDVLRANPIEMTVAGGTMNLDFSLNHLYASISPMVVKAKISDAKIQELFLNFNNFNQKTIHADNLRGRISADVNFRANVDNKYQLITPSMRGTLDCKIAEGGLVNFEPMENMSNFLFKKRDFSDVEFAELNSNFSISGTDMDISRMEIQSTVLSLFLEGRYSFTDSTSLSVQIPLSNLKKRHKDFKPKNIGTHAKAGPSVFLHVYREKDINSKIKIDYDPFKKWAGK